MPLFYSHRKRAFMRWLRLGSKNIKGTLDMKAFQDFLIMFLTDLVHIIYLLISFFSFIHNTDDKTSSKLYISCIRKKHGAPSRLSTARDIACFSSLREEWLFFRGKGTGAASVALGMRARRLQCCAGNCLPKACIFCSLCLTISSLGASSHVLYQWHTHIDAIMHIYICYA